MHENSSVVNLSPSQCGKSHTKRTVIYLNLAPWALPLEHDTCNVPEEEKIEEIDVEQSFLELLFDAIQNVERAVDDCYVDLLLQHFQMSSRHLQVTGRPWHPSQFDPLGLPWPSIVIRFTSKAFCCDDCHSLLPDNS